MEKPRCGMKDPPIKFKLKGKRRQKRYTLQGETWDFSSNPSVSLEPLLSVKDIFFVFESNTYVYGLIPCQVYPG